MSVYIIHIESSTEWCSVALAKHGDCIALKETDQPRSHSSLLSVYINDIIQENRLTYSDLNAVCVSIGPGSYTGLRVGLSTAKGICYAQGIPLIALDSLEILAFQEGDQPDHFIVPMIDARRMEVYTSVYEGSNKKQLAGPFSHIITERSFGEYLKTKNLILCGNGAKKALDLLESDRISLGNTRTSAKAMCELGYQEYLKNEFKDTAYISPQYLKPPNITTAKKIL